MKPITGLVELRTKSSTTVKLPGKEKLLSMTSQKEKKKQKSYEANIHLFFCVFSQLEKKLRNLGRLSLQNLFSHQFSSHKHRSDNNLGQT